MAEIVWDPPPKPGSPMPGAAQGRSGASSRPPRAAAAAAAAGEHAYAHESLYVNWHFRTDADPGAPPPTPPWLRKMRRELAAMAREDELSREVNALNEQKASRSQRAISPTT